MGKKDHGKKDDEATEENEQNEEVEEENTEEDEDKNAKRIKKIKGLIREWIGTDEVIKTYNQKIKKHKDAKKEIEEKILVLIEKTGLEEHKFTMKHDDGVQRIYRAKSVSKGAYKEDMIRESMMSIIGKEKVVDKVFEELEGKRQVKERFYLKKTKGKN